MSQKLLIKKADGTVKEVTRLTNVQRLITQSFSIIEKGLEKLDQRANMGMFNKEDALIFSTYVKAIKDLSHENREQEKEDDIKKLSDEEIKQLAQTLLTQGENKNEG